MAHVLFEYHIKVKKSGGAFKVIPTILMHYYSGMLDSDLERVDKRKLYNTNQKLRLQI